MEFKSKSSNVASAKYDKDKKSLEVKFTNGVTYVYNDVALVDYQFFKEAKSHGKFLASNIVPKYKGKVKPKPKKK